MSSLCDPPFEKSWLPAYPLPLKQGRNKVYGIRGQHCSPLCLMFVLYEFLGRRSFIDPICCNSCMVLSMSQGWFLQIFLFSLRDINLTLGLLPPEDAWCGVILWVLRVLGQGLRSECANIFIRVFSGCCAILTSSQKGETAVYGYNPALF